MPQKIDIPDDLFQSIQDDAIPFVDLTPISVLRRWAERARSETGKAETPPAASSGAVTTADKEFNPLSPPDLLHTITRGSFGSAAFRKWNDLVRTAHVQAFAKAETFEALRGVTQAQIRKGNHEGDSGFHFVPEIGVSIQGVDANHAWSYSLRLAQYCKTPISAQVEWRHNEKAAFPGKTGLLAWSPANV